MSYLQIRDVPPSTRQVLKARAAAQGVSLNTMLLQVLDREAERPTVAEVLARAASRSERSTVSAVDVIRSARDARERDHEHSRRS